MDNERPRHDLRGHVENLREDPFAIDLVVPEVGEGLAEAVLLLAGAGGVRHLHQRDDDEHDEHDESDDHVRVADDGQVMETDGGLLGFRERGEEDVASRVALVGEQVGQHDERGHRHTAERAHRVERLRKVQPARGVLLAPEREDEWTRGGLQEGQTEGEDVEREAEVGELLVGRRGDEEEGAHSVEGKSKEDALLVGELPDEERRRDGHRGVTAVEGKLHKRGFRRAQLHHRLERCYHRVGDVVGEAPQREQRGDEDEREQILPLNELQVVGFQRIVVFHKNNR